MKTKTIKGVLLVGQKDRWIALVAGGHTLTDHTLTNEEAKKLKDKLVPVTITLT